VLKRADPRRCALLALLVVVGACAADGQDLLLIVEGDGDRFAGEQVVVDLVEGIHPLGDSLELVAADGQLYPSSEIAVQRESGNRLRFTIPGGAAPGLARVRIVPETGPDVYAFSLNINRLAVAATAEGVLQTLPLPPTSLAPSVSNAGNQPASVSLSPGNDMIVVLSGTDLFFFAVGKQPRALAQIVVPGAKQAVATPKGALVATGNEVQLYSLGGSNVQQVSKLTTPGVKAISADSSGFGAVALTTCEGGDCVILLNFSLVPPVADAPIKLDDSASATLVSMRQDGDGVVVPDSQAIYGVGLSTGRPVVSSLDWQSAAKPVAIARTTAMIERRFDDLFAIADAQNKRIRTVGFEDSDLRSVRQSELALADPPQHIAFGRGTRLYVLANKLVRVDVQQEVLQGTQVAIQLQENITGFDVQR